MGYLKICVSAGCFAMVKGCEGGGVGAGGCLEERYLLASRVPVCVSYISV